MYACVCVCDRFDKGVNKGTYENSTAKINHSDKKDSRINRHVLNDYIQIMTRHMKTFSSLTSGQSKPQSPVKRLILPFQVPEYHMGSSLRSICPTSYPVPCSCLGKAAEVGPKPSHSGFMWETQKKFLPTGYKWAQIQLLWPFGE